jgi:hypothetical protein
VAFFRPSPGMPLVTTEKKTTDVSRLTTYQKKEQKKMHRIFNKWNTGLELISPKIRLFQASGTLIPTVFLKHM